MNNFITIILLTIIEIPIIIGHALLNLFKPKVEYPITVSEEPIVINIIRPPVENKTELTKVTDFLSQDTTSDKSYGLGPYQCTQFSRDLSAGAKRSEIGIGGIILGNSPNLETYSNHALNYIIIDDIFYIINAESDFIIPWDDYIHKNRYKYYKLYPDGTLLPTRWTDKLYNVYPISMLSGKQ